jgi:hypothetical protein
MRTSTRWFLILTGLARSLCAQTVGQITGLVLNEAGNPIEHAKVHVEENKAFYGHRILQVYLTDARGQFVIDSLQWGSYVVLAGKEDEGYADTKLAFYSNLNVPVVTVTSLVPTQNVTIHLGPRAGVIEVAAIIDAGTGKAIVAPSVTLRRTENGLWLKASGTQKSILIPSRTKVSIEVEAEGYQVWHYPGDTDASRSTPVVLEPGEHQKIEVKLQPKQ